MTETNPTYPVKELAIRTTARSGYASTVSDIIAVRDPGEGIGTQEDAEFVWMRVQGWEEAEYGKLLDHVENPPREERGEDYDPVANPVGFYDARRYQVHLQRIQQLWPHVNGSLLRDRAARYQPILLTDRFWLFIETELISVHGIIFDKVTQEYLP